LGLEYRDLRFHQQHRGGVSLTLSPFPADPRDFSGRDAIRAIRKRLQTQMAKNNAVVMYTLTVRAAKAESRTVLAGVGDVREELRRALPRSGLSEGLHHGSGQTRRAEVRRAAVDPGTRARPDPGSPSSSTCIDSRLQSWADAFRGQPALNGVCLVYDDLKSKGVEFPMTDLDAMAPILTPKRVSACFS
jgi:hypothetical protein